MLLEPGTTAESRKFRNEKKAVTHLRNLPFIQLAASLPARDAGSSEPTRSRELIAQQRTTLRLQHPRTSAFLVGQEDQLQPMMLNVCDLLYPYYLHVVALIQKVDA